MVNLFVTENIKLYNEKKTNLKFKLYSSNIDDNFWGDFNAIKY